jgi:glycosyltransferase involved in cell wall biosynthesis
MFLAQKTLMRIGLVTSSYAISPTDSVTAGVFVRDLAYELATLGHQVHVISPKKFGQSSSSTILYEYYIPWLGREKDLASASMYNPLTLVRYMTLIASGLWTVGKYAQAHALDVLLSMWAIPNGLFCWLAWKQFGIPYGVWALGSDIWSRRKYPLGDFVVRLVLRDAQFRFADGRQLSIEVARLAGAGCEFVPSMRKLLTTNNIENLVLSPGFPHFLFIGRYEYNKGPDILVEAMRNILDWGYKAHLYIFGEGSLETYLRQRAKGYEQYIHIGKYADPQTVITYMHACDWLVIPSRIESIPLVFVDALQMQLPVIVTDVGDLGDLVRQFGVGKVVSVAEPYALSVILQEALTYSGLEFSGAWKDALEIFSIKQSVKRCDEFLSSAIRDSSKRSKNNLIH